MREFLITVLCVCSVSGFRIFPVRSVEIITEGEVTESLEFTNQPTTVAPPLVPTSVLSTDSTSSSLSNTASEISSSPDTTVDSKSIPNSFHWSVTNFQNPVESRPNKIAPSSKGPLGTALVPVTNIASTQQTESASLSNTTATSLFITTSTNTEQSISLTEPPATTLSESDVASSAIKGSETTTPTESATIQSDPVSTSAITEELSSSTEPAFKVYETTTLTESATIQSNEVSTSAITEELSSSTELTSLSSSKSDTTSTSIKNFEVRAPITFISNATSTLQDSQIPVSTLTTIELSSSSSESPATNSSKSDTILPDVKNSEANILITTVAEQAEPGSTDSLKFKYTASNSLSAIKDESSSKPASVLSSDRSKSSSTGSQEPTTESIIIVETTTQDLSFLSLTLLPPKTEYRKNEPDPRYDY